MQKDQIYYFFKTLLGTEILVGLSGQISGLCSVAVNGRLLPAAVLAAMSLTVTFDCILNFVGFSIRRGSTVVLGRQMGKGNVDNISAIGSSSLVCMGTIGIVMIGLLLIFPDKVAILAGADPGSNDFSCVISYFRGYVWSPVFKIFTGFLLTLLQLKGRSLSILITTGELFAGNLLFALSNALLFGASAFGAGLAQSCAQFIPLVHLFIICVKDKSIPSFKLNTFSFSILKEILIIGVPLSAISFFVGFRNTVLNHIIFNHGGMAALSAKAVYSSVIGFSDVFVTSVPAVAVIIAGIFVGERNKEALINLFHRSLKLTILITAIDIILVMISAGIISELLSSDPQVSLYASRFVRISVIAAVFEGTVILLLNYYISLNKLRFVNIINVFHCVILHIVFSIILSKFIGMYGVFASYPATEITILAAVIIWAWLQNKGLHKISDILLINESINMHPHLATNIFSKEDMYAFISQIQQFCTENNVSERTSFLLQLCSEEMISNIFDHSFTKGLNERGLVHAFVSYDINNGIELIIRDNGPLFDPSTVNKIFYPEQPEKNIGIRLIWGISDEFVWQNVIGMNTLIIKLKDN